MKPPAAEKTEKPVHFIRKIIADDVAAGHLVGSHALSARA